MVEDGLCDGEWLRKIFVWQCSRNVWAVARTSMTDGLSGSPEAESGQRRRQVVFCVFDSGRISG